MKFVNMVLLSFLLVFQVNAENQRFLAEGEEDGNPVIYRSMKKVPDGYKISDYPTLIHIQWFYDVNANNGMPDSESNKKQVAFEDAIVPLIFSDKGHLMLVTTGNGVKDWLFYVKNEDFWMKAFNSLLRHHESYPLDISVTNDETWSAYYNFLATVDGI